MNYKVELLKYRNNIIRTLKIFGQGRVYWNFDDIVEAAESEVMTDIFNDKIKTYSKLFESNTHEFIFKTGEQEIILNDEYSYMFDGGKLWGYIPRDGATLITQNQIEYLLNAKDGYSNDFRLWYNIEICNLDFDEAMSFNKNKPMKETKYKVYCIDENKIYANSTYAATELNIENVTPHFIEKACVTGEKYAGHYWCFLDELEDYINNYED